MSIWDGEGQRCWVDRTLASGHQDDIWILGEACGGRCQEVKMETEGDRYISGREKLS